MTKRTRFLSNRLTAASSSTLERCWVLRHFRDREPLPGIVTGAPLRRRSAADRRRVSQAHSGSSRNSRMYLCMIRSASFTWAAEGRNTLTPYSPSVLTISPTIPRVTGKQHLGGQVRSRRRVVEVDDFIRRVAGPPRFALMRAHGAPRQPRGLVRACHGGRRTPPPLLGMIFAHACHAAVRKLLEHHSTVGMSSASILNPRRKHSFSVATRRASVRRWNERNPVYRWESATSARRRTTMSGMEPSRFSQR